VDIDVLKKEKNRYCAPEGFECPAKIAIPRVFKGVCMQQRLGWREKIIKYV
jgi:hypothetical protein